MPEPLPAHPTLREAARVWAHVGINSFGGPAGQIAVIHREVVDRRRWIGESRFLHALNYCMLLPGPEAQQLATYTGWLMNGVRGGLIAGTLFVLPGFLVMLALAMAFATFGDVGWVSGAFAGIQAGVIAIVVAALHRIATRSLRTPMLVALAAAAFLALLLFSVPFPWIVVAALVIGAAAGRIGRGQPAQQDDADRTALTDDLIGRADARAARRAALICLALWLAPVAVLLAVLGTSHVLAEESVLFSKTAVIGFGGAYAVIGYIADQAVSTYGWMSSSVVVTGLGLAETTPGPLVLVAQFVGFMAAYNAPGSLPALLAGTFGALVAVWVTFLPCFAFVFMGAPAVERLRHSIAIRTALAAVSACVVGVIAHLGVWFGMHTLFREVGTADSGPISVLTADISTVRWGSLTIAAVAGVLAVRRIPTLAIVGACAVLGLTLHLVGVPG